MTPHGRKFVLSRLFDAPDLNALKAVWETISDEYKRDPVVVAAKDSLKEALK